MTRPVVEAKCPVCRALVRLRVDGCLRKHTRPVPPRWRRRCEGTGRRPEAVSP